MEPARNASPANPACPGCNGGGQVLISTCCGRGCATCPGDGMMQLVPCFRCKGSGTLTIDPVPATASPVP